MKKTYSKILWGAVMVAALGGTCAIGTTVMNGSKPAVSQEAAAVTTEAAKAEVVPVTTTYTYYYRVYGGWIQKRLWNRTYGCWAQSKWTNVQRVKK